MNGLGARIQACRALMAERLGKLASQGAIGHAIASKLGGKPISAGTVSRWESGEFEPSLDALQVLAELAFVDPGWLAFGPLSKAPSPRDTMPPGRHQVAGGVLARAFAKQQQTSRAFESLREVLAGFEADNKPARPPLAKKARDEEQRPVPRRGVFKRKAHPK